MLNLRAILKHSKLFFHKHSTKILAGLAVASEIGAVIFAAKEGPIAQDRLKELGPDAKWTDKLKKIGPVYLPAFGMLALSTGCIIGGCAVGEKKVAILSGLYSASEAALKEYEKKVVETVGHEKAQEIQDAVAQQCMEEHPITSATIYATGHGDQLIYDPLSGRYFTSDPNFVVKTASVMNQRIQGSSGTNGEMFVSVNEWYYELGLEPVGLGDYVGWSIDNLLDIPIDPQCWSHTTSPDNRSAFMITYYNKPGLYK